MSTRSLEAEAAEEDASELVPFSTADCMNLLISKAAPHLSRADLRAIAAGAAEEAQELARSCAEVADALGCLISADGNPGNKQTAGDYQSADDVPGLLFHFARQFGHIEAMASMSTLAHDMLRAGGHQ